MRRLLSFILLILFLLTGCGQEKFNNSAYINSETRANQNIIEAKNKLDLKAVWFSYIELDFIGLNEEEALNKITNMFTEVKNANFNAVICQVRANCDAAYPSKYFPFSNQYKTANGENPSYDPLKLMVDAAHNLSLEFHAWINPYRISAGSKEYLNLPTNSPAYIYLTDQDEGNDKNVLFSETGMYLNPASEEVRNLVTLGVEEILNNYDIDGIQFDDYFYPTTDKSFDKVSYNEYTGSVTNPLPLDDWRRTNVNLLISQIYRTVHRFNGVCFGISPAADISFDNTDNNYQKLYADIPLWCNTKGYIDYIAPQLYFGYNYPNESFCFNTLLKNWCNLSRATGVKLYVGLAAYKLGTLDAESDEWIKSQNILAKQSSDIKKADVDGVMLYSYSYLFNDTEQNINELDALKKELK